MPQRVHRIMSPRFTIPTGGGDGCRANCSVVSTGCGNSRGANGAHIMFQQLAADQKTILSQKNEVEKLNGTTSGIQQINLAAVLVMKIST